MRRTRRKINERRFQNRLLRRKRFLGGDVRAVWFYSRGAPGQATVLLCLRFTFARRPMPADIAGKLAHMAARRSRGGDGQGASRTARRQTARRFRDPGGPPGLL